MLIACAMIAPMAISLLREGGREQLEAAPSRALSAQIAMAVADGAGDAPRPLPAPIIRATKLGQRLYVEVDFVIDPLADAAAGLPPWTIGEEDAVRRAITTRLDALGHEVWATVELTTDPGLAAA